jgi:hypothetical protein
MHASTRILLLIAAIGVLVAGIWVLFSVNGVAVATGYSVAWALIVLVVTRVVLGVGSGYNALRARFFKTPPQRHSTASSALEELTDLRGRNLISEEEYQAKRATVLGRL